MKTILIVDDRKSIRLLLQELFSAEGMETVLAANGPEALDKAAAVNPDVILLDMKIPGMDGIGILKRLKANDQQAAVIMMTAFGEPALIEEAMANGASLYFIKPFDAFELLEAVKGLL